MKQILTFCCSLLTPVFLFAQKTPVQDVHFVRGIEFQQAGKLEEAISECELSLKTNPRYPVLANLGAAYARLGRYQDAIARYEEALKLAPGKPEITGTGLLQDWRRRPHERPTLPMYSSFWPEPTPRPNGLPTLPAPVPSLLPSSNRWIRNVRAAKRSPLMTRRTGL